MQCRIRLKTDEMQNVREEGLEPSRQRHKNLNLARLPIPPLAHSNRTAVRQPTAKTIAIEAIVCKANEKQSRRQSK